MNPQALDILTSMFPFLLIMLLFYFLIILPQQKKDKEHKNMLNSLKKGDRVVTAGGICGNVYEVKEKSILLEIAPKIKVEVLRSGIISKG